MALLSNDSDVWRLRIEMNQQMLFSAIKQMAQESLCNPLINILNRQWFGGYHPSLLRMLPNGEIIAGAPISADLSIRNEIISEVLDGLKNRPRDRDPNPSILFVLSTYEYDIILAMAQLYLKAEDFLKETEIDAYEASAFETTIYTLFHVARTESYTNEGYKGPTVFRTPLNVKHYDA